MSRIAVYTGSFDPPTDNTPQKRGILRTGLAPLTRKDVSALRMAETSTPVRHPQRSSISL